MMPTPLRNVATDEPPFGPVTVDLKPRQADPYGDPSKLTVINLWGAPSVGKSTLAAGLFNLMKERGHRVELVTEYAKERVYQRDLLALGNQLQMLGEQDARLRRLVGKVDYAITDSPLPLSLAYMTGEYADWLPDAIWGAYDRYMNVDVFVRRVKGYQPYGRSQTESEALALDLTIKALFDDAVDHSEDPLGSLQVDGDWTGPYAVAEFLGVD